MPYSGVKSKNQNITFSMFLLATILSHNKIYFIIYSTHSASLITRKKDRAIILKQRDDISVCLAPAEIAFSGFRISNGAAGIPGSW